MAIDIDGEEPEWEAEEEEEEEEDEEEEIDEDDDEEGLACTVDWIATGKKAVGEMATTRTWPTRWS